MATENEVRNELEQNLVDAQIGHISSDVLLEALMGSQVFMPVEEEKAAVFNIQRSARAQAFVQDYPGYGGGSLTEFTWVLEKMGRDYGIALNPGSEVGFDMKSETVNELIDALTARTKH